VDVAAEFERHRGHLFGVAYRMLGSVADAEDLVQEAFGRLHQADAGRIADARAWLTSRSSPPPTIPPRSSCWTSRSAWRCSPSWER